MSLLEYLVKEIFKTDEGRLEKFEEIAKKLTESLKYDIGESAQEIRTKKISFEKLKVLLENCKKTVSMAPPNNWTRSPEEWKVSVNRVLILGGFAEGLIPGLDGPRATCDVNGILSADAILVPLEDGDRCEALVNMGLKVIVVDLNPLSRSSLMSTIAIVDDVTRFSANLQEKLLIFNRLKRTKWDNKKSLQIALDTINETLQSSIE